MSARTIHFSAEICVPVECIAALDSEGTLEIQHVRLEDGVKFFSGNYRLEWHRLPLKERRALEEAAETQLALAGARQKEEA